MLFVNDLLTACHIFLFVNEIRMVKSMVALVVKGVIVLLLCPGIVFLSFSFPLMIPAIFYALSPNVYFVFLNHLAYCGIEDWIIRIYVIDTSGDISFFH